MGRLKLILLMRNWRLRGGTYKTLPLNLKHTWSECPAAVPVLDGSVSLLSSPLSSGVCSLLLSPRAGQGAVVYPWSYLVLPVALLLNPVKSILSA